jgi:hypothetical protein
MIRLRSAVEVVMSLSKRALIASVLCVGCGDEDFPAISSQAITLALETQSSIEVDLELAKAFDDALTPVWDFDSRLRCVGNSPEWALDYLVVSAAPASAEAAWNKKQLKTGVPDLDALLEMSGLESVSPAADRYYLRFGRSISTSQLALSLNEFDEMHAEVEPNLSIVDNILMADPRDTSIRFVHGWGDCVRGCISEHIWDFTVMNDGVVRLDEEMGDELQSDFGECAR